MLLVKPVARHNSVEYTLRIIVIVAYIIITVSFFPQAMSQVLKAKIHRYYINDILLLNDIDFITNSVFVSH